MWETLERARRRLRRDDSRTTADSTELQEAPADLSFALGKTELERLIGALSGVHGPDGERPDTPARLQAALSSVIEHVAGHGRPSVTRRPAGLYTPETWQIDVEAADGRTRTTLEQAIRGGGPA